jgi:hypothetical protein
VIWRRLDPPGHDACRLLDTGGGWLLTGTAVFRDAGGPACLTYRVECDRAWRAGAGLVEGWIGRNAVAIRLARTPDGWTLNGHPVPSVGTCVDVDLNFTPATNLIALARLNLGVGQQADATAAWLDVAAGTLTVLPQRYHRRGGDRYWYEAPTVGYAALLEVAPSGFVRRYPGLWEAIG